MSLSLSHSFSSLGDVKLTYFGKWDYVPYSIKIEAVQMMYVAPGNIILSTNIYNSVIIFSELQGLEEATISADWWSLGAILFELLTGKVSNNSQQHCMHTLSFSSFNFSC